MTPQDYVEKLTPREREALVLTAKGFGAAHIAERWGCSKQNVHRMMHQVYRKLEVGTAAEAAVVATKAGLV